MVFPKNKEFYAELKNTVIEAYHEARNGIKQDISKLTPDELKISVSNFRENTYENNIKGDCQVTINDNLVLKGVKLVQTKETGELKVTMASREQAADGTYPAYYTPISPEIYAQINTAVREHYNNLGNIIGNTPYSELGEVSVKALNPEFAQKVIEQLEKDGVKWSGIAADGKTKISVSKADAGAFEKTEKAAKEIAQKTPPAR
jgi:DNA-binding cell septation regulator SpoVG